MWHVCTSALGGLKGASESLELKSQVVVHGHVGSGDQTPGLHKGSESSKPHCPVLGIVTAALGAV